MKAHKNFNNISLFQDFLLKQDAQKGAYKIMKKVYDVKKLIYKNY